MKAVNQNFYSVFVKFHENSVPHQIFFKQHKVKEESNDRPSDLTLFVTNIPPYYDEVCMKKIFNSCGLVRAVYFASIDSPSEVHHSRRNSQFVKISDPEGYKVSYVIFTSACDVQKALSWKPSEPIIISKDEFSVLTGLGKWCKEYNDSFPLLDNMDKEITTFMSNYDKEIKDCEIIQKQKLEPDEDGWVTVSKRGRNPGFARKQSVKDNLMKVVQRKKRKKTLLNFYTFQIKESKMNNLTRLREKFEEDKKKLENLKLKRKFKPF